MNAHAISYPSLQRRLIAERRSRALFLPRTTQHLRSTTTLLVEIGRAIVALAAVIAWGAVFVILVG